MSVEQQYIDLFKQHKSLIFEKSSPVLNEVREEAFADFQRMGFPTDKQEDFLYTNLSKIFEQNYGMNLKGLDIPVNPYEVFHCGVPGINSHLYFVVNDRFFHNQTYKSTLPEGVLIGSLKDYANSHPELVKKQYAKIAETNKDSTVAFNTAFAEDGFFLYVPKGVIIEKPIQLINVMRADVDLMANSRNLIIIEEGAQAKLLVCAHTMDYNNFLCNRVTEVYLGENAHYEHYKLENTHDKMVNIGSLYVNQQAKSSLLVNEVTLHNGLTRNNVTINLNGEHAQTILCGMGIGDKTEHIDNHTFIHHAKPNCTSKELYKYVLNDSSKGAFAGKILVAKDAQKTEAVQTNKNICMTKEARMQTKPQLEIYADDVKCSHGATVGQLDEEALFYLRSRGISEHEAKMLLMYAFVDDVIENINVQALKDNIRMLVEKRFRGELDDCKGCGSCS
jgi:Fe-S cluster assembly protein SufD